MQNASNRMHGWLTNDCLEQLSESGFCVIDHALPTELISALGHEFKQLYDSFKHASIETGHNHNIRRDRTRWIEPSDDYGRYYLDFLLDLRKALNQHLYTTIRDIEAHYAHYDVGDFYAPHSDNPQGKNNRLISAVLYLNEEWDTSWGGQLRLRDTSQHWHDIYPLTNRLVLFQSNLLHEVCATTKPRQSITAWLRQESNMIAF